MRYSWIEVRTEMSIMWVYFERKRNADNSRELVGLEVGTSHPRQVKIYRVDLDDVDIFNVKILSGSKLFVVYSSIDRNYTKGMCKEEERRDRTVLNLSLIHI